MHLLLQHFQFAFEHLAQLLLEPMLDKLRTIEPEQRDVKLTGFR